VRVRDELWFFVGLVVCSAIIAILWASDPEYRRRLRRVDEADNARYTW
jgi:hypothetical protein